MDHIRGAFADLLENICFENCTRNNEYRMALGLTPVS
jgi:hypothetical protein